MPHDEGFRGPQVCKIVGITYRQLDYWARTDLLKPSLAEAKGSGTQRRYSYRDLLELKVIARMLHAGLSLQSVRRAVTYMRDHLDEDVVSANLVLAEDSVLIRTGEEIVDLLRGGQGVLNIVSLAGVKDELDTAITALGAESAAATPAGATSRRAASGG